MAWASTCNTVGQTAGYFMGHVVFMALESHNFCNRYIRFTPQDYGMVDLAGKLLPLAHITYVVSSVQRKVACMLYMYALVTVYVL